MTLSTALIYFGMVCFLVAVLIIAADRKMIRKCGGNEALRERVQFFTNKWQGEHAGLILAPFGVSVILVILSCLTDLCVFLYLAGIVLMIAHVFIYEGQN